VRSAGVTLEAAGGRIQHWIQRAWVSPVESECQQAKPGQKRGRGRKGGRVGIGGGGMGPRASCLGARWGRNPPTGGMGGVSGSRSEGLRTAPKLPACCEQAHPGRSVVTGPQVGGGHGTAFMVYGQPRKAAFVKRNSSPKRLREAPGWGMAGTRGRKKKTQGERVSGEEGAGVGIRGVRGQDFWQCLDRPATRALTAFQGHTAVCRTPPLGGGHCQEVRCSAGSHEPSVGRLPPCGRQPPRTA